MRKNISGSLLFILTGLMVCMLSCVAGSCFEETESYVKASFYNDETGKLTPPDTLTLSGLNNDSLIYNRATGVQPALIPLNASTESCSFIIEINGVYDTIGFRYDSYPHLISKECGYTFYHHLDTALYYSKNLIKKINTTNSTVTNLNVENIRIYY